MRDTSRQAPTGAESPLPSARLAVRIIADVEGAGIAAQWLDDRTGNPLMTIIARRSSAGPWLVPTHGIATDQLVLGLASVLDAASAVPGRRLQLDVVCVGRQSGLTWETAVAVEYDALDPINPSKYTVSLIDLRWQDANATRQRMRYLGERLRGRPSKFPTPTHPAASEADEIEGSPSLALAVKLIASEPESVVGQPGDMASAIPA